jgi:septal ring factor EnvC (AmiA/AmiB activator)
MTDKPKDRIEVRSDGTGICIVDEKAAREVHREVIQDLVDSYKYSRPTDKHPPDATKHPLSDELLSLASITDIDVGSRNALREAAEALTSMHVQLKAAHEEKYKAQVDLQLETSANQRAVDRLEAERDSLRQQLEQVTAERDDIAKSWHDNAVFLNEQFNSAAMDFWNERERAEAAEAREAVLREAGQRYLAFYGSNGEPDDPAMAFAEALCTCKKCSALRAHEKAAGEEDV